MLQSGLPLTVSTTFLVSLACLLIETRNLIVPHMLSLTKAVIRQWEALAGYPTAPVCLAILELNFVSTIVTNVVLALLVVVTMVQLTA